MKSNILIGTTIVVLLVVCSQAHLLHKLNTKQEDPAAHNEHLAKAQFIRGEIVYYDTLLNFLHETAKNDADIDRQVTNLFAVADTDKNGVIDWGEFLGALTKFRRDTAREFPSYREAKKYFDKLDSDHSGTLSPKEVKEGILNDLKTTIKAAEHHQKHLKEKLVKEEKKAEKHSSHSSSHRSSHHSSDDEDLLLIQESKSILDSSLRDHSYFKNIMTI